MPVLRSSTTTPTPRVQPTRRAATDKRADDKKASISAKGLVPDTPTPKRGGGGVAGGRKGKVTPRKPGAKRLVSEQKQPPPPSSPISRGIMDNSTGGKSRGPGNIIMMGAIAYYDPTGETAPGPGDVPDAEEHSVECTLPPQENDIVVECWEGYVLTEEEKADFGWMFTIE